MKYFEYGKEHGEIAVILHGGGTSYRGVEPTAWGCGIIRT